MPTEMATAEMETGEAVAEEKREDGDGADIDGAAQPSRPSTFRKFRELLMVKRFENFDNLPILVAPGLFIGSLGAASNLGALKAAGITHVLCVASSVPILFPDDVETMRLPLPDLPSARLADVLPDGIAFVDRAISSGGSVLVHCFVGRSRSVSMVIAFLMARRMMTLDAALNLLKSVRPQVQPNSGFLAQLRDFEAALGR